MLKPIDDVGSPTVPLPMARILATRRRKNRIAVYNSRAVYLTEFVYKPQTMSWTLLSDRCGEGAAQIVLGSPKTALCFATVSTFLLGLGFTLVQETPCPHDGPTRIMSLPYPFRASVRTKYLARCNPMWTTKLVLSEFHWLLLYKATKHISWKRDYHEPSAFKHLYRRMVPKRSPEFNEFLLLHFNNDSDRKFFKGELHISPFDDNSRNS